jgi:protein-tyrosine-phosphatase
MRASQSPSALTDRTRLVLIVCTGNICRSPMAEGMLAALLPAEGLTGWTVQSRGLHAVVGAPATDDAVRALAEIGVDIRAHRGRLLTRQDARSADLVLTLEQWHRDSIRALVPDQEDRIQMLTHYQMDRRDEDIDDPYGQSNSFYKACRDEIRRAVKSVVEHLKRTGVPGAKSTG